MSKSQLKEEIRQAFRYEIGQSGENPEEQINRIADKISSAVFAHVQQELLLLKAQLVAPGAYAGTGTGVVTINPVGIATYTPSEG